MELKDTVYLEGSDNFRSRILLSTLSGKSLKLKNIRPEPPPGELGIGLKDFEVGFLKLVAALTNGTLVDINDTGTTLYYKPGIITGGNVVFDCPLSKPIGYYLEMILPLAPFSKAPFILTLTGITNDKNDPSVDSLRLVYLYAFKKFGLKDKIELKINKRGSKPLGDGQVFLNCPVVKSLCPVQFKEPGRVKRIIGMASCTKLSSSITNRLAQSCRLTLTQFTPDVYVYTDVRKGSSECGKSPGFALTLVSESTKGVFLFSDSVGEPGVPPESIASDAVTQLLSKINEATCVDPFCQWLYLLLMALGPEDVSTIQFSTLTPFSIQFLRDLKAFFGITFKLKEKSNFSDESMPSVIASCIGIGYRNYALQST